MPQPMNATEASTALVDAGAPAELTALGFDPMLLFKIFSIVQKHSAGLVDVWGMIQEISAVVSASQGVMASGPEAGVMSAIQEAHGEQARQEVMNAVGLGVPWLVVVGWIIQYGPQVWALLQQLIAEWRQAHPTPA